MASSEATPFAPIFEGARRRFIALAGERLLLIEAHRISVQKGTPHSTALCGIADVAHKISGVASTVGFSTLGDAARELEVSIRSGLASIEPSSAWEMSETHIETFLDSLESILDA